MWQAWVKSLISRNKIVQNIINTTLEVPGGYITTCFCAQYTSHTWCRQYKSKKQLLNFCFGTGLSNTLSPEKYIWNFLFRPERKIGLRQKNFWLKFLKLNCVLPSVGVLFCYRTLFKWIGRLTKLTIYDFRHVHIKSRKNVILSICKTKHQLFCLPYQSGPIHRTTFN